MRALSPEEKKCFVRTTKSFYDSEKLWNHIKWLLSIGRMYLIRDGHLIFHGLSLALSAVRFVTHGSRWCRKVPGRWFLHDGRA